MIEFKLTREDSKFSYIFKTHTQYEVRLAKYEDGKLVAVKKVSNKEANVLSKKLKSNGFSIHLKKAKPVETGTASIPYDYTKKLTLKALESTNVVKSSNMYGTVL
nr:hypothetical protein [Endozoicomonas sp.]